MTTTTPTAAELLERQYLTMRCGILDLAAEFDRLERSDGFSALSSDERLELLAKGLEIVASSGTDRAERIQLLFSDEYVDGWNK